MKRIFGLFLIIALPSAGLCLSYDSGNGGGSGAVAAGTSGYVPKYTGTTTLGQGLLYDSGTNLGLGTASPATLFHISSGTLTIDGTGASIAVNGTTGATLLTTNSTMSVIVNGGTWGIGASSMTAPNGYVISMATQTYVIPISSGMGWNGMSWPVFSAPDNTSVTLLKITAVTMPASSTVTYQLDERTLAATNSAGSSIFSVAYSTGNNTGVTTTSFSDSSIAAGSGLVFTTPSSGASSGAPASIKVTLYYKRDS